VGERVGGGRHLRLGHEVEAYSRSLSDGTAISAGKAGR
jgi:hypothetical protein